jgi:5-(carboxyamino)imidazole ribonucleotide synthase
MVGGGQLARMTHQAAIALGQTLRVLATSADEPAALVSPDVTLGAHTDLAALRGFAKGCDVLTFDHEHVPGSALRELVAEGVTVAPPPEALLFAQDKLAMRRKLRELDFPVPPFAEVTEPGDLVGFIEEHGGPVVLKAVRGGYDGRGVWMPDSHERARRLATELLASGTPLLVETKVALTAELAVLVARSPFGQGAVWPVIRTVQMDGICVETVAPAPGLDEERVALIQELGLLLARHLGVVGVLAVELFATDEGILVNELAMRPHNSGHWTIEGAVTSQFEQHLRACLDYPLGSTAMTAPVVVTANVLGAPHPPVMGVDERLHHLFARFPTVRAHLYGKEERPGRKVGHVTVLGERVDEARRVARLAAHWLSRADWADGFAVHPADSKQEVIR